MRNGLNSEIPVFRSYFVISAVYWLFTCENIEIFETHGSTYRDFIFQKEDRFLNCAKSQNNTTVTFMNVMQVFLKFLTINQREISMYIFPSC